ncbi:PREDICTED: uncharacterized protein LOC109182650 [Ipomoea nil]|uniref:uncharacterized protein LOC109182650 n=1 Tax=Ipomoea nil TaxID=35883 RepID=UPI000900DB34|nr:PREDICTED: uncharacterized protein LOC109182650 [Ipomoea nil]
MSLLISSLSDEVMYLAVGRSTSREVWEAITATLGSSSQVRCLNLLGQFQSLRQGNSSPAEYLSKAQLIVEALALAGRPLSLDEQNMYVFRGLRPEFRAMASSLTVTGTPVSISQLSDYLQAQEFIYSDDYPATEGGTAGSPAAFFAGRGRHQSSDHGGSSNRGGQNRGRQGRGRGGGGRGRGRAPRCQICRSHGHTAVYCYKRYTTPPPAPQVNLVVAGDDATVPAVGSWFPNTGATAHATPDSAMVSQSEEYTGSDVLRVGNGAGLTVSRDSVTKATLLKGPVAGVL